MLYMMYSCGLYSAPVSFAPLALIPIPLENHLALSFPAPRSVVEGQSFSSIDNRMPAAIAFCSNGTVLYFTGLAIDVTSSLVTSLDKPVPDGLYHLIRQMQPIAGAVYSASAAHKNVDAGFLGVVHCNLSFLSKQVEWASVNLPILPAPCSAGRSDLHTAKWPLYSGNGDGS